ncbi:hypothetical protein BD310DRAFT_932683 [Dichomitus squalens]|uniref:Secreted protein n=1 Tax=Dichomitus squalens TaxID=114155 RepID=A0A4Q9PNL3_9APHY|nr:hypothetical protein BD310DRAFT_932683 [Dichomitus squalens]
MRVCFLFGLLCLPSQSRSNRPGAETYAPTSWDHSGFATFSLPSILPSVRLGLASRCRLESPLESLRRILYRDAISDYPLSGIV